MKPPPVAFFTHRVTKDIENVRGDAIDFQQIHLNLLNFPQKRLEDSNTITSLNP